MNLKEIEFASSILMTAGIYIPFVRRLLLRKHSRDFSKVSFWFVLLIQVNNLPLTIAEHAPYLTAYYAFQSVMSGFQLYLIYHYWNYPEPSKCRGQDA